MERTIISLPESLYYRVKARAEKRRISMAALIRETLEERGSMDSPRKIGEARTVYLAEGAGEEEAQPMKRLVISLSESLHQRVRRLGDESGISMAAYIRGLLEEHTRREPLKPQFGAFDSGHEDTASMAGEIKFEPRSWR